MRRSNTMWYTLSLVLLWHVLTNMPSLWILMVASVLVGLFPIRHPRWWKYGGITLLALVLSMLWSGLSGLTLQTLGQITGLGGFGMLMAVVVVDVVTVSLLATTVQWWLGRWLLARQYGFKPRS
ncbi:MAG: hypothetical protein ACO3GL_07305 [Bacteroidia bacterium]